jgi:Ser/Thr protein kinase RdoA (MazF antagonist)
MNEIRVSSSIVSAEALGLFLKQQYGWDQFISCRLLRAGINHTYLVESSTGKYVFRLYSLNWRTRTEIQEEIELVRELKEKGLSVSYALPSRSGEYIIELMAPEGIRSGVLFSFAEGTKQHQYPVELHREVGRLMATFHKITSNRVLQRTTYNLQRLLEEPFIYINQYLGSATAEMQYLKTLSIRLLEQLGKEEANLRKGAVHLDIWFENFAITPEQQLILFDFDFCGNGFQGLDLAFYQMQVYNLARYEQAAYSPNLAAFLEGYQSVLPIPEEELRLLPELGLAVMIFYLGVQCQRFENWSNTFLSEDYLKRFINGIIRRYDELHPTGATRPVAPVG